MKQLVDDVARYLYLPRISEPEVLLGAIRDGVALLTWETDTFAFAESRDESAGRYRGLRGGQQVSTAAESSSLSVKPDVARRQLDTETRTPGGPSGGGGSTTTGAGTGGQTGGSGDVDVPRVPERTLRRFHGTVELDPERAGRDASRIADEVIAHLVEQVSAEVTVTIEIETRLPNGASDQIVRAVTENSRTLRFTTHGFESE